MLHLSEPLPLCRFIDTASKRSIARTWLLILISVTLFGTNLLFAQVDTGGITGTVPTLLQPGLDLRSALRGLYGGRKDPARSAI